MKYFEVPRPSGDGLCSDNDCPCPEVKIPRGSGYLYVSQKAVDFRKDAPTVEELKRKLKSISDFAVTVIVRTASAIIMCEEGAKLRGIDLKIAAADAKHWWKTGLAPLRATPKANKVNIVLAIVIVLIVCVLLANWIIGGIAEKRIDKEIQEQIEQIPFPILITYSGVSVNPLFVEASLNNVAISDEQKKVNINCKTVTVELSYSDALKIASGKEFDGIHSFNIKFDDLGITSVEENAGCILNDFTIEFNGHITKKMFSVETGEFPDKRQQLELKLNEFKLKIPQEILSQFLQRDIQDEISLLDEVSTRIVYDPDAQKITIDQFALTEPVLSSNGSIVFEYEGNNVSSFVPKKLSGDSHFKLNLSDRKIGNPDITGSYSLEKVVVESFFETEFEGMEDLLAIISGGKLGDGEATFLLEGLKGEFSEGTILGSILAGYEKMIGIDLNEISLDRIFVSYTINDNRLTISDSEFLTPYFKAYFDANVSIITTKVDDSIINSAKIVIKDLIPELESVLKSFEQDMEQSLRREGTDIIIEMSGRLGNPQIKD